MTSCVICHKDLLMVSGSDIIAEVNQFVCICFDCIKKQNKN